MLLSISIVWIFERHPRGLEEEQICVRLLVPTTGSNKTNSGDGGTSTSASTVSLLYGPQHEGMLCVDKGEDEEENERGENGEKGENGDGDTQDGSNAEGRAGAGEGGGAEAEGGDGSSEASSSRKRQRL